MKDGRERNLRFSFKDGAFAGAMIGFTQDYFTPFLLVLGGTSRDVGILSALPNLCAALGQLKSADLSERLGSRKKVVSLFVLLQAIMLVPMAAVAFFQGVPFSIFIGIVTLFTAFGAFAIAPWSSIMSNLIDEKLRGEYFGRRNKIIGSIIVATSFLAGSILHSWKEINVYYGFCFIFLLAFIFRLISWRSFLMMEEPPLVHKKEDLFTFFKFLRRTKESNFAKYVLFVASMSFAVSLASPYFAVFMLRDLHFNYVLYSLLTVCATLMIYLMMSRWGRHADVIGNLRVIRFAAPLIGVLPILWVMNRSLAFLFCVQVFSGFVWSGFQLCSLNFIYDAVSPAKRTRCISYFNAINGVALCLGALTGGMIVRYLPFTLGYRLLTLFIISSVLRILVSTLLPVNLKEVRPVKDIGNGDLFLSIIGIRPLPGTQKRNRSQGGGIRYA